MQDIFDGECGLNVGIWVEQGHVLREALPYSCWGLSNTSMGMILLCMRHHCELMMVYYPHTTSSRQSIHASVEPGCQHIKGTPVGLILKQTDCLLILVVLEKDAQVR